MILRFPTGFYSTVLPQKPSDSGNVTFTVSTTEPPRTRLLFSQVPIGINILSKFPRSFTNKERRKTVGALAFTISTGKRTRVESGAKRFEAGQVLEFTDIDETATDPMLVGPDTTVRHDTNLLDLEKLGFTDSEVDQLDEASMEAFKQLSDQLNAQKSERANVEVQISDNKRLTNETRKAIDGLTAVLAVSPSDDLAQALERLKADETELKADLDKLIEQANKLAADATTTRNDLFKVAQLVR